MIASNVCPPAQAGAHSKARAGAVPPIRRAPEAASEAKTGAQKPANTDAQRVQKQPSRIDQGSKGNQNDKIKQIHNQLNENAETYTKMYDAMASEKQGEDGAPNQRPQQKEEEENEEYDEEEESEEEFIDINILSKLRF